MSTDERERAELLPCPFCGHRATGPGFNADLWWISCTHCEAEMSYGTRDGVVSLWQREKHAALAATPTPAQAPAQQLPPGVYYNADADNFYNTDGVGMTHEFYRQWQPLCMSFPRSRLEASITALAAAPPQAAAQAPAVTAKPIVWKQDNANQWSESDYGFYITLDTDEDRDADNPYFAAWGEGDEDRFDSLEAAQRWCQDKINSYFREYAVVHAAPAQAAQPERCVECDGPLQWRCPVCKIAQSKEAAQAAHSAPALSKIEAAGRRALAERNAAADKRINALVDSAAAQQSGKLVIRDNPAYRSAKHARHYFEGAVQQTEALRKHLPLDCSVGSDGVVEYANEKTQATWVGWALGMRCAEKIEAAIADHPATQTPRPNDPELGADGGAQGKEER